MFESVHFEFVALATGNDEPLFWQLESLRKTMENSISDFYWLKSWISCVWDLQLFSVVNSILYLITYRLVFS